MKQTLVLWLTALVLGLPAMKGHAEAWPARPIKVIVPITPGSVIDVAPRIVFEQLATQLGQAVVIENRPGAGQTIGAGAVARSEPDGYTLLVNSAAHAIAPALYPNLDYHPARDFAAVVPLGQTPFVLVAPPQRGFRTAAELTAAAKSRPGGFNFSSPGVGSASHLSAERFRLSAGIEATHVPFKGGAEAMTEVIAGRIDFAFIALGAALPHIRAGRLVPLAVNGVARSPSLPDVSTLRQAGFTDAEYPMWFGVFVPARTPRSTVERLHRETVNALQEPRVRERLAGLGVDPLDMTPAEFDALVHKEIDINAGLVRTIGLRTP
jgi:tripartite-type tricarboxylate transporter receptor subunit TctC